MPWEDGNEADKGAKKCLQWANTVESDCLHAVTSEGCICRLLAGYRVENEPGQELDSARGTFSL